MKKIALLLIALFASLALYGCNNSEFKVDGEFTAYEVSVHGNAPMVTTVTVTVEDGKIIAYDIDARQGTRTQTEGADTTEDTTDDVYEFAWNSQTKKGLGFNYKMHYNTYVASLDDAGTASLDGYQAWLTANEKKDWFQQAELIEAYWLENGVDSVTTDEDTVIDNVSGVTIKDGGYIALAADAVELAKLGKFQAILCSGTDLYSASMIVDEDGEISQLKLDTLQKQKGTAADVFAWNTQTKQQLGFNYKMHYNTYVASLDDADSALLDGYQTWLIDNDKLEWFQQANLITDYIMEHGWQESYADDGIDSLTAVTITSDHYYEVLDSLFDCVAD